MKFVDLYNVVDINICKYDNATYESINEKCKFCENKNECAYKAKNNDVENKVLPNK